MLELVPLSCQIQRLWNIFTLFLLGGYRIPPTNGTNILVTINLVFLHDDKDFRVFNEIETMGKQDNASITLILRIVGATIVAVESYFVIWVYIFKLGLQHASEPHCHLWPAHLYKMFPHYIINGNIFEKEVVEHKMRVLIFCITLFEITFLYKKNWARCNKKSTWVFM